MSNAVARAVRSGDIAQLMAAMTGRLCPDDRARCQQTSMHEHLWSWLCWLKGAGRADATLSAYGRDVWEFIEWLQFEAKVNLMADELAASHLQDYQAHLGRRLGRSSIRRKLDALSGLFKYLVRAGVMESNPLDGVPRPRSREQRDKWMPEREAMKVLDVLKQPIERAVFMICYRAGLRRGEVQALKLSDVDLKNRMLRVFSTKNRTTRHVPISEELARHLEECLGLRPEAELDEFFVTKRNRPVGKSTLDRWFRRWMVEAGLVDRGYRLHDLRHSAATNWVRNGLNVVELARLLGHRSLESVGRYLHHAMDETRSKVDAIEFRADHADGASSRRARTNSGELTRLILDVAKAGDVDLLRRLGQAMGDRGVVE
jgi:integrase